MGPPLGLGPPGLGPPRPSPMGTAAPPESPAGSSAGVLRVITCGSVDDGKSTLIGRLLHDAKAIHLDQLEAVRRASVAKGLTQVDLALLTDGLRAEREQGITIDVAYRYFTTPRRRFILADTPGHAQYTRNMATGASTADCAVIVLDARNGVVEQTRRHACIAALLGAPQLFVCINKMDLVGFDQARFEAIRADFLRFAASARPDGGQTVSERAAIAFIPLCALDGDNIIERSPRTPWFKGPPLLERLETAPDRASLERDVGLRLPVQYVIRPLGSGPAARPAPAHSAHSAHQGRRAYAGRLAAGRLKVGDEVAVLPSGLRSRVSRIFIGWQEVGECAAGSSPSVLLADDLDVARGDVLVSQSGPPGTSTALSPPAGQAPMVTRDLEATLVWMSPQPLAPGRRLIIKHAARSLPATVRGLADRLDVASLHLDPAPAELALNQIGRAQIRLSAELVCDPYASCRDMGAFILIDDASSATLGAGLILPPRPPQSPAPAGSPVWT